MEDDENRKKLLKVILITLERRHQEWNRLASRLENGIVLPLFFIFSIVCVLLLPYPGLNFT